MRLPLGLALAVVFCCGATLSAGRITFERTIPAPIDLGRAEDLAVVYAIGDNDGVSTFIDILIDQATHGGVLRVYDARNEPKLTTSEFARRRFRRRYSTDYFLKISAFTCTTATHSGEGSAHDFEGKRIRRRHHWVDAVCRAHIDILDVETLEQFADYDVRGEGTSQRVSQLTDEEQELALEQAARYAAVAAAEQIAPRRVREAIALEEKAPAFDEGMSMIDSDRLRDARSIWEREAARRRDSAPLHFNLGAVCEAMGDLDAARKHYREAQRLAPKESRYRNEWEMFRRRNRLKE